MTWQEAEQILPGKYRHYKGNEYEVLYVARHSETEEPMVVYRALYGEGGVWVRPARMWNETVERDGRQVRRFEKIPEREEIPDRFARTRLLLGDAAMNRLKGARVAVFGIGGVGGYVCEALARSGVGALDLVDSDRVSATNLNRQIIALESTVGQYKADVMAARIRDIDPQVQVRVYRCFFLPENAADFPFGDYDYVVDAVDTVTAKLELIRRAKDAGVPVISAMGAGNKLDAGRFKAVDISETSICPLARVMRKELKKRGIEHLKVVYSDEKPQKPQQTDSVREAEEEACAAPELPPPGRKALPGSIVYAPAVCGLMIAAEVIRDLTKGVR